MITQARLKKLLTYSQKTGLFRWKVQPARRVSAGDVAGSVHSGGYVRISIDGRGYLAHRLAVLYMTGVWSEEQVDHDDHDRSNNKWLNLKLATNQENSKNQSKYVSNLSGVCGVGWDKATKKWRVRIHVNGKAVHGGSFKKKVDAAARRKQLEIEHGFHDNHGI